MGCTLTDCPLCVKGEGLARKLRETKGAVAPSSSPKRCKMEGVVFSCDSECSVGWECEQGAVEGDSACAGQRSESTEFTSVENQEYTRMAGEFVMDVVSWRYVRV